MANVGWYPDPGGQPGLFRYWNGSSWSAETTSTPRQTPPPSGPPVGTPGTEPRKKTPVGVWIGIGAAVLVVAVIIWAVVQFLPNLTGGGNPWQPGGNPTQNFCPQNSVSASPSAVNTEAGRIASGHLSYPALGDPWKLRIEREVPYAGVTAGQIAIDQPAFDGQPNHDWVSEVLVTDITSGDGFGSTQAAAEKVMSCVIGLFYSDTPVAQKVARSSAYTVDGHKAWLLESQLSFSVPGLRATGERAVIVVVELGSTSDTYGLFYSSVPNTRPEHIPDADHALKELRVDG